jgi:hypothetical protein
MEVNHLRLSKALEVCYGLKVTEGLTSLFEREYTQQLTQICLSLMAHLLALIAHKVDH